MTTSKLETWIWVLIYAGLGGVLVGAFALSFDEVVGHALIWSGITIAAIGALGIWVRSRMRSEKDQP